MKFGENLYNLRKKQKISQEKLAEKIGVSRQSVSKWENGTAYPEMNRIFELCKIFHCKLNDLVNDNILDFNSAVSCPCSSIDFKTLSFRLTISSYCLESFAICSI